MFKTVEREAVTVYGWITTLNAPNSANGLAEMSNRRCGQKKNMPQRLKRIC